jgi:hypothetical protein
MMISEACKVPRTYLESVYLDNNDTLLKISIFWNIMTCIPLKFNPRFGGTHRLHHRSRIINQTRNQREACSKQSSYLAYCSTLKMEAIHYSETKADFQWTTRHYIAEDRTLHNHSCENLKSYKKCEWKSKNDILITVGQ